jgi:hypothetical protein
MYSRPALSGFDVQEKTSNPVTAIADKFPTNL